MTDRRGFTLLELVLVMVLIGLTMAFAVPRLDLHLFTDPLKQSGRKLTQLILDTSQKASRTSRPYVLEYDPGVRRFSVFSGQKEEDLSEPSVLQLPDGVSVQQIVSSVRGEQTTGKLRLEFSARGYLEPSLVYLRDSSGNVMTLKLSPFLSKVSILSEYVALDENTFR